MENREKLSYLLVIVGLLFALMIACDKKDDIDDENQNTEKIEDSDGNVYNTVKIGTQIWMAENLKTTKYNDSTPIPNISVRSNWIKLITGAYCDYDNLENNVSIYGRLYNWYAVNSGRLAPPGWHVPTDDEWEILHTYVNANRGNSVSVAKSLASKTNWLPTTITGAIGNDFSINNSTGFRALPGGIRNMNGMFQYVEEQGSWWSSSDFGGIAYLRQLNYNNSILDHFNDMKCVGYSVRLIKDN